MKLAVALSIWMAAPAVSAFGIPPPRVTAAFVRTAPLYGILDEINSGSFDLLSSKGEEPSSSAMEAAYEQFLADLVFSTNDPRVDIVNNFDRCADAEWLEWLDKKVNASKDPEERVALKDLYEMIIEIQEKIELSNLAEERAEKERQEQEAARVVDAQVEADKGRKMSNTEILQKAAGIDTAAQAGGVDATIKEEKKSFYEEHLTPEIRMSYEKMLKKVLPPYEGGDTVTSIAFKYYDQFDAQFVKVLTERSAIGEEGASGVLEALAVEQQKRISHGAETLKSVLALGDPMRMEGAIVKLAREGKIDEPFLLLLEANATQARDAGALGPAQLMDKLRARAAEEKDKQISSKEIRLIRQLLRTDDAAEREKILEDAFTPRENLLVAGTPDNAQRALDGTLPEEQQPMPDVPPPVFINACKAVLLNFGNLGTDDDRGDLATRIKLLASEAEVVATRIYGKGMTLREQQDRAWKEETTSIFDLEQMEIEAERMGETAPWTNPDASDDSIPGFDASGRMKIGGT